MVLGVTLHFYFLSKKKLSHTFLNAVTAIATNLVITQVMTVAGQKNHYNVKLLKDYEISINPTRFPAFVPKSLLTLSPETNMTN